MYDRYTISANKELLEKTFGAKVPADYQPSFNASPTNLLPVITMQNPEQIVFFRWGFISSLSNNKTISPKLYNLPAAGAFTRPPYRKALEKNRCVIVADGFFAWKQVSKKQRVPHYFYFNNQTPFGIAGVWEESEDLDGNFSSSFNMLTTTADATLEGYQEDMPLLLPVEEIKTWLSESTSLEDLEKLAKKVDGKGLQTHPVSPLINDPGQNNEMLIRPTPPSDQFGNYTLFN